MPSPQAQRIHIIGNPVAGRGRAEATIATLARALEDQGCAVTVALTAGPEDARRLAAELDDETGCLVVAGGDGTIHEVINGLADPGRLPLAILGLGGANLLARELRLPTDPAVLARAIVEGRTRRVDLGVMNGTRRFLAVASVGFDAAVIRRIHETRRGPLGLRGYPRPILHTLQHYRPPELRIHIDGGPPLAGALVVVANTPSYLGILSIADRAGCDSGQLDVVIFPHGSVWALAKYAWASWRHRISRRRDVHYLTGKHIRIEADKPIDVEVDGEHYGQTPVEIDLRPAVVPLIVAGE